MRAALFVTGLALVAGGGCKSDTEEPSGGSASGSGGPGSGSGKSGFGAQLNAELGGSGGGSGSSGTAAAAATGSGSGGTAAANGSGGTAAAAGNGSGNPQSANGSGNPQTANGSGNPQTANGSGNPPSANGSGNPPTANGSGSPQTATGSGKPPTANGSGSPPTATGSGNPPTATGSGNKPVGTGSGSAVASAPPPSTSPRVPVKVSPELAAIKLSLQPNWDRDVGDPATISLVVKRPTGGDPVVFSFTYGYDDPRAPADREAYLKFLTDNKLLAVTSNRQRGAAWYIEGTDANGPAFRYLVNYGGKHLVCFGSLYKDPASSALLDIRDEVVNQAKKICETLAL